MEKDINLLRKVSRHYIDLGDQVHTYSVQYSYANKTIERVHPELINSIRLFQDGEWRQAIQYSAIAAQLSHHLGTTPANMHLV